MRKWSAIIIITGSIIFFQVRRSIFNTSNQEIAVVDSANCWTGAGIYQIPVDSIGLLIRYGRELIRNTAYYLGPKGIVSHTTNGMNCQNCHLDAGTKPWGNNYGAVASLYPKKRDRSNKIESIEMRVNDCLQRSLNGQSLNSLSKEMRAIVAYIKWVGKEIPKGTKPKGTGIEDLAYLLRAADPAKGKQYYFTNCSKCHAANGAGMPASNGIGFGLFQGP